MGGVKANWLAGMCPASQELQARGRDGSKPDVLFLPYSESEGRSLGVHVQKLWWVAGWEHAEEPLQPLFIPQCSMWESCSVLADQIHEQGQLHNSCSSQQRVGACRLSLGQTLEKHIRGREGNLAGLGTGTLLPSALDPPSQGTAREPSQPSAGLHAGSCPRSAPCWSSSAVPGGDRAQMT